jgi:hypothetical protein
MESLSDRLMNCHMSMGPKTSGVAGGKGGGGCASGGPLRPPESKEQQNERFK